MPEPEGAMSLDEMMGQLNEMVETPEDVIYLDVPPLPPYHDADAAWHSVATFPRTEEGHAECIRFIRERIGQCDEFGRVSLLSNTLKEPEEVILSSGIEFVEIPRLNERELATVLAALRMLQRKTTMVACSLDGEKWERVGLPDGIDDIITDGGTITPLTDDEIDALCERLNCGKDKPLPLLQEIYNEACLSVVCDKKEAFTALKNIRDLIDANR